MADFLKVKFYKPEVIIVDFFGTMVSTKWEDEIVIPYILNNLRAHIDKFWNDQQMMEMVINLRAESFEQRFRYEHQDAPVVEDDDDDNLVKTSFVNYIRWQMNKKKETVSTIKIQRKIWEEGLAKGELKTAVFEDVKPCFSQWANEYKIKIYVYAIYDLKDITCLLRNTNQGDLTPFIAGYFDQTKSARHDPNTFAGYATALKVEPKKVLLITHFGKDAKAGGDAGLDCALVVRPGVNKIREYYTTRFNAVISLLDIQLVAV